MDFQQPSLSSIVVFCTIDSLIKSVFYHTCRVQGCYCKSFGFTIEIIQSKLSTKWIDREFSLNRLIKNDAIPFILFGLVLIVFAPLKVLRYYLDKLDILDKGNMCYSSLSRIFWRYTRSYHVNRQTVRLAYQRSDLE